MKDSELFDWIVANPGLAQLKESQSYPGLAVAKYKRKVFYDDLWNRQLEECRGAVFDLKTKKLVALPFRLIGITFTALFAFLQALFFLPARALGWRPSHVQAHHPTGA